MSIAYFHEVLFGDGNVRTAEHSSALRSAGGRRAVPLHEASSHERVILQSTIVSHGRATISLHEASSHERLISSRCLPRTTISNDHLKSCGAKAIALAEEGRGAVHDGRLAPASVQQTNEVAGWLAGKFFADAWAVLPAAEKEKVEAK